MSFILHKMKTRLEEKVVYELEMNNSEMLSLNPLLGKHVRLIFSGAILCVSCGKKTKKSFSDGYCYPCAMKLASCDLCQTNPERCHFAAGTCREENWAKENCFIPHTIYLSNTSGIKVGITRTRQEKNRWMDQGATQALPIMDVGDRLSAGLIEVALKDAYADKTNYRAMLSGPAEEKDLVSLRKYIWQDHGAKASKLREDEILYLDYPILEYPKKIVSHNLDKTPTVEGKLMGIKAQYLILDSGVINLRKFTGYQIDFETGD
jgi:hypothetical protein